MDFVPVHPDLWTHPKTVKVASITRLEAETVVTKLLRLWTWAFKFAQNGDVTDVCTDSALAAACLCIRDTDRAAEVVKAFVDVRFIDRVKAGAGFRYELHDWNSDGAGRLFIQRQRGREYTAKCRENKEKKECKPYVNITKVLRKPSTRQDKTVIHSSEKDTLQLFNEDLGKSSVSSPKAPTAPVSEIVSAYNSICKPAGMPEAKNGNRKSDLIRLRWREHPDLDWWKAYFQRAANSKFLCGQNDSCWKANLVWLLNATNLEKVEDGNYDLLSKAKPKAGERGFKPSMKFEDDDGRV